MIEVLGAKMIAARKRRRELALNEVASRVLSISGSVLQETGKLSAVHAFQKDFDELLHKHGLKLYPYVDMTVTWKNGKRTAIS